MAAAECVWTAAPPPVVALGACTRLTSGVAALGVAKWGAGESYFLGSIAAISVLSSGRGWRASWIRAAGRAAVGAWRRAAHPGAADVARRAQRAVALAA